MLRRLYYSRTTLLCFVSARADFSIVLRASYIVGFVILAVI